jgi:hypothetical protein
MNLKSAAVALLTFALPVAALAIMPVDPQRDLLKAGSFAMGGVGVAGTMSNGERALRQILKEADAASRLEGLIASASPAGQLYALVGLRAKDGAAYARALEKLKAIDTKVETMRGCILQRESFRHLVKEIESGGYDPSLAREWPTRM